MKEIKPKQLNSIVTLITISCLLVGCASAGNKKDSAAVQRHHVHGLQPLDFASFPGETGGPHSMEGLYAYKDPDNPGYYYNVFKTPEGRIISITLVAISDRGRYAGDKILVSVLHSDSAKCLEPITIGNPVWHRGRANNNPDPDFGTYEVNFDYGDGGDSEIIYQDSPVDGPQEDPLGLTTLFERNGPKIVLSVKKLRQLRADGATEQAYVGGQSFNVRAQGGATGSLLFFAPGDTNPTYVVECSKVGEGGVTLLLDEVPIDDSGYMYIPNTGQVVPEQQQ